MRQKLIAYWNVIEILSLNITKMDEKQQSLLWQRIILEAQIKWTRLSATTTSKLKQLAREQAKVEKNMLLLDTNNQNGKN